MTRPSIWYTLRTLLYAWKADHARRAAMLRRALHSHSETQR